MKRLSRQQATRALFLVFLVVALLVPVVTAILNEGSETAYILDTRGRVPGEFGTSKVLGLRGGFVWRFFEWHIFGDSVTGFDWLLIDAFGLLPSAIIDVFNPTLFHVSILFGVAALIARTRGAVSSGPK